MIKPIAPNEVTETKIDIIFPDFVIEAFNYMIAQNFRNGSATVAQDDVITKIFECGRKAGERVTRNQIFDKCWLDVEDIYRAAGWKVKYDKPAYCESYSAYFEFTKKPK